MNRLCGSGRVVLLAAPGEYIQGLAFVLDRTTQFAKQTERRHNKLCITRARCGCARAQRSTALTLETGAGVDPRA
jgi:hypothetical protein